MDAGTNGVQLRNIPGTAGAVSVLLQGGAPLRLIGRSADNGWLQVVLDTGEVGWLLAAYVRTTTDLNTVAITGAPVDLTPTPLPEAVVKADAGGLRLRESPTLDGRVIAELPAATILRVLGRTDDHQWLQVQPPSGAVGWVSTVYVDMYTPLDGIPVTGFAAQPTAIIVPAATVGPPLWTGVITNITDNARRIFAQGQSMGNRADVFSKVGDSITVASYMYYPIGQGRYNLVSYTYLQPVINYFSAATARDANSFANVSLAADNGWTTASVLNTALASYPVIWDPQCQAGETPLECEYRESRPAIALIMLGTNDVEQLSLETYRANLERIIQISIGRGIIPVLSTVPYRPGYDVTPYNRTIRELSTLYSVPLWDYWSAMLNAPNYGICDDMIHPSFAPGDPSESANFRAENLGYGYVIRNLTALMVLDAIWRQVIQSG